MHACRLLLIIAQLVSRLQQLAHLAQLGSFCIIPTASLARHNFTLVFLRVNVYPAIKLFTAIYALVPTRQTALNVYQQLL